VDAQPREAVSVTLSALMSVHFTESGPAETFSPSPQDTVLSPTLRVACPPWTLFSDSDVPRTSTLLPELTVTEQELPEQSTLSPAPSAAEDAAELADSPADRAADPADSAAELALVSAEPAESVASPEQPASGTRSNPPATTPAASLLVRDVAMFRG
jgi:hypothetical protein